MHNRIAQIIVALGIKRIEFAKRIGISSPFVSELCSGAKKASDRTISDICREFNVSETWLRTGEGEMFDQREETIIEQMCAELHASELESEIIRAYFQIDPKIREPFMRRLLQEVSSIQSAPAELAPRPRSEKPVTEWTTEEINAEAEEYRRSLLEEKKRGESGSASSGPSSDGIA